MVNWSSDADPPGRAASPEAAPAPSEPTDCVVAAAASAVLAQTER